jgi:hypothetical protein
MFTMHSAAVSGSASKPYSLSLTWSMTCCQVMGRPDRSASACASYAAAMRKPPVPAHGSSTVSLSFTCASRAMSVVSQRVVKYWPMVLPPARASG